LSYRHIDKFNIIIHKNSEYSRSKKCCPIHCHSQAREILEALSLEDILHKTFYQLNLFSTSMMNHILRRLPEIINA
jgi:hypothetical protein